MPTRLYLANTAPPVSPAPHSQWQNNAPHNYGSLVASPTNTARTEASKSRTGATVVQVPAVVLVSAEPLTPGTAFTTSDTITAVARAREGTTSHDVSSVLSVRIVDGAAAEVAVLYTENIIGSGNVQEWATSLRNAKFPRGAADGAGTALTGGHTVAGPDEYLEVTLGGRVGGSNGAAIVEIGDVVAESDLAHNATGTSAGRPWVEFSNTFSFYSPVESAPPTGAASAVADAPASTVTGGAATSSPPSGEATAAADPPARGDFPRGDVIEDATTAEDPLSRSGAWRTATPDLGSAARVKASGGRLVRSSTGTNASVRSDTAPDAGIAIPAADRPPVDLSATVAVQPGSAGAFAEIGLATAGDLGSTWSGYAVGVGQQGRCYVAKYVAGVQTKLLDTTPRSGASVGTDRFGVRLTHTDDGLELQAYFRDATEGVWYPHDSPAVDSSPLAGEARVFVRLSGNNASNSTSSALDDLRLGTFAEILPPAGAATAAGTPPASTLPGTSRTSSPPTGAAVAEGVAPMFRGDVQIRTPSTGEAFAEGDDEPDALPATASADPPLTGVNLPMYVQIGSLRAEALLGPMVQAPTIVEIESLTAEVRPGAAEIAQRIHAGPLRAELRPGAILVAPGVLTVPIGGLRLEGRPGAGVVAQRIAVGSLSTSVVVGGMTLSLYPRPVTTTIVRRAGTTATTRGRAGTTATSRFTRN